MVSGSESRGLVRRPVTSARDDEAPATGRGFGADEDRRSVAVHCQDEVRDEVRRVRGTESGDRVPARRGRVARDARVRLVLALRDVEEVLRVAARVGTDLVEGRVDEPQAATVDLVGDRYEGRPLGTTERRTADVIPAGRAGAPAAGDVAD